MEKYKVLDALLTFLEKKPNLLTEERKGQLLKISDIFHELEAFSIGTEGHTLSVAEEKLWRRLNDLLNRE